MKFENIQRYIFFFFFPILQRCLNTDGVKMNIGDATNSPKQ
jgi:hypothetical protein